jgi:putative ABC transport system substrate-binding protein
MITRRTALVALGSGVLLAPSATFGAAQPKVVRIGYLANRLNPAAPTPTYKAFFERLVELGWVEGRNMEIRIKSSGDDPLQFATLARELVQEHVDLIMCGSLAATRAAKAATSTIPIVFGSADNPVEHGLVANLRRPGGNVTGLATIVQELGPKQLEILKEVVPHAKWFARLYQPASNIPAALEAVMKQNDAAARMLGVRLEQIAISDRNDITQAFASARNRIDGIYVKTDGLLLRNQSYIAELGLQHKLPVMGGDDRFAEAGTLLSYGESFPALYRRAAELVDKILKDGVRPADLPVETGSPELVVNLRTARELGVTIPPAILFIANRKIA